MLDLKHTIKRIGEIGMNQKNAHEEQLVYDSKMRTIKWFAAIFSGIIMALLIVNLVFDFTQPTL